MALLSHRQGWSFVVLLAIFPPCVCFAGADKDASSITYRTGTSEVRVTFFATDQNNRLVETVETNDFAVVDGETVIRNFRSLVRSEETALDIVVLVDASESVAPHFDAIKEQVWRLVTQHRTSDQLSIVTFSGLKSNVLCATECGDPAVAGRLRSIRATGSTPLFDSLASTAKYFSSRQSPTVRQVLVLFSDGNDTISGASAREALNALTAIGAVLYPVNLAGRGSRSSLALQEMAETTGGRLLSTQESESNVLETILADLHASYVVTYPLPSRTAGFRSLRILPKHNLNLRFHCRRGYFYDEDR